MWWIVWKDIAASWRIWPWKRRAFSFFIRKTAGCYFESVVVSDMVYFHTYLGKWSNLTNWYFSNGLEPPTRNPFWNTRWCLGAWNICFHVHTPTQKKTIQFDSPGKILQNPKLYNKNRKESISKRIKRYCTHYYLQVEKKNPRQKPTSWTQFFTVPEVPSSRCFHLRSAPGTQPTNGHFARGQGPRPPSDKQLVELMNFLKTTPFQFVGHSMFGNSGRFDMFEVNM